jgi:UrcA family protein
MTMNTITPSSRLRGLIAMAIVSTFASSFAAVCAAADRIETVSAVVKYGDLNISNPEGAAALYRRIVAAARNLCGPYDVDTRDLVAGARMERCAHKAIADAVTKVGQSELFAVYNAKNREPLPITVAATQRR